MLVRSVRMVSVLVRSVRMMSDDCLGRYDRDRRGPPPRYQDDGPRGYGREYEHRQRSPPPREERPRLQLQVLP